MGLKNEPARSDGQARSLKQKTGIETIDARSLYMVAEWEGFEPSQPCDSNDLANRPLQPLEYHSKLHSPCGYLYRNKNNNNATKTLWICQEQDEKCLLAYHGNFV